MTRSSQRLSVSRSLATVVCAALLFSATALPARAACDRSDDEYWDSVKKCTNAASVEEYLKAFPTGCHVAEAQACLKGIERLGQAPKCAGLQKGDECWLEVADRRGCHIWQDYLDPEATVTWSGKCAGGLGVGQGTIESKVDWNIERYSGMLHLGKKHGRWVHRYDAEHDKGDVEEGPYVHGRRHGRWVYRSTDGTVWEGPYANGELHGRWTGRIAGKVIREGSYANGWKHGRWVYRHTDGDVYEGSYANGELHGHWVRRYGDGSVDEGSYAKGERHGVWVERNADGDRLEIEYRNGSKDGQPGVFVTADGKRHPGRWLGDCFRGLDGKLWVWSERMKYCRSK